MDFLFRLSRPQSIGIFAMLFAASVVLGLSIALRKTRLEKSADLLGDIYRVAAFVFSFAGASVIAALCALVNDGAYTAGYNNVLYLAVPSAALALVCCVVKRQPLCLLDTLAYVLFVPGVLSVLPARLLIFASGWLLVRSVLMLAAEADFISGNISRFSVKEAFDCLPDGVLFANADGVPVLINQRMEQLLGDARVFSQSSVQKIWQRLCETNEDVKRSKLLRDGVLIRESRGQTLLFERTTLSVGGRAYTEITALDVSEQSALSRQLDVSNSKLKELNNRLVTEIDNLDETERERQIVLAKSHFHDVLGQRLSLVHQLIENPQAGAGHISEIKQMIRSIAADVKYADDFDAASLLEQMRAAFYMTGVELKFQGLLPPNEKTARTLLFVIREAATNAVRHARADTLRVAVSSAGSDTVCTITNNGRLPPTEIQEGDGIRGMRYRVAEAGGTLTLALRPRFQLTVTLPSPQNG